MSPPWSPLPHVPGQSSTTPLPASVSLPNRHGDTGHPIPRKARPCQKLGLLPGQAGGSGCWPHASGQGCRQVCWQRRKGEEEGEVALPAPLSCCNLGACSTRGWRGKGFAQVARLGSGVSSCCRTTSFVLVSASKKSRWPFPQLRAAQRPRGWAPSAHKTENLRVPERHQSRFPGESNHETSVGRAGLRAGGISRNSGDVACSGDWP